MGDIRIGNVIIADNNQNDFYEPVLDQVKDRRYGSVLTGQSRDAELKVLLQELGVKSWKGIYLSEAADYVNAFNSAEKGARQGEPGAVEFFLGSAAEAAKNLGIKFDATRAKNLHQQALMTGIATDFQDAEALAKNGAGVSLVQGLLIQAKGYVQELKNKYQVIASFDQNKADQILESAYQNEVIQLYKTADHNAQKGDILKTSSTLSNLERKIAAANKLFNLGLTLDQARYDQILGDAYQNGIPLLYQDAMSKASQGQTKEAKKILGRIQTYIGQANKKLGLNMQYDTALADQILEEALLKGIEENFFLADQAARKLKLGTAKTHLKNAEDYVMEYNKNYSKLKGRQTLTYDQARADAILDCAAGKSICP